MTLYVDTSALVRRYLHDPQRSIVEDAMDADGEWCASAMVRSETQVALHRAAASSRQQAELWRALRDEWECFWVVPLDDRCLARAVEIGAAFGVRLLDAIHLAAADRLPEPVRFLTFDRQQIPAAAALGFEVVSPDRAVAAPLVNRRLPRSWWANSMTRCPRRRDPVLQRLLIRARCRTWCGRAAAVGEPVGGRRRWSWSARPVLARDPRRST